MELSEELKKNNEFWKDKWNTQKTGWHLNYFNPFLVKYINEKFLPENEEKEPKAFVPLCGKSKDMIYLLSKGLSVFGIESILQPIEEFDKEYSLGLVFNEKDSIYHTLDGKLRIYFGDFFKCPIKKLNPSGFDFIYDRGSFTAVDYCLRKDYIDIIKSGICGSNYKYLLQTVRYDKTKFKGPPKSTDEKDLEEFYAYWNKIEILEIFPVKKDHPMRKLCEDLGDANDFFHILTPKN